MPFFFKSKYSFADEIESSNHLDSNILMADTATFTFTAPFFVSYKDVIINEILADISPVVGLPAAEFVELYNHSTHSINLNNWSFHDNITTATANLPNIILQPDSFIVLCSTSTEHCNETE